MVFYVGCSRNSLLYYAFYLIFFAHSVPMILKINALSNKIGL